MGVVNLPVNDELAAALKRLPAERRAAITDQLASHLLILVDTAAAGDQRALRARRIAGMTPKRTPQTDSVSLIREDRDR